MQRTPRTVRRHRLGGKGVQVCLVAGRDLQGRGLHLDKIALGEPAAHGRRNAASRQKAGPAQGVGVGAAPGSVGKAQGRVVTRAGDLGAYRIGARES